jgi:hypothetical protein
VKTILLGMAILSIASTNAMADVKHFVAFKYKNTITEKQVAEVEKRFLNLKKKALRDNKAYILSIEAGKANSKEGMDQGMTHGFIVTFKNESDRDYYVGKPFTNDFDPAHEDFKQFVGPLLSVDENGKINGVYVFDFTTK